MYCLRRAMKSGERAAPGASASSGMNAGISCSVTKLVSRMMMRRCSTTSNSCSVTLISLEARLSGTFAYKGSRLQISSAMRLGASSLGELPRRRIGAPGASIEMLVRGKPVRSKSSRLVKRPETQNPAW